MVRISGFTMAALLMSVGLGHAHAQASNTVWRCWYEGRGNIACVVEEVRSSTSRFDGEPLSPYAPEILRVLREDPGRMRGRVVSIPIHTVPYEMGNVARLAQLTVCGNRPDCQMVFTAERPSMEMLDKLDVLRSVQ